MTRKEVFKLIDAERDYQDEVWTDMDADDQWTPAEWLSFIEEYVGKCKDALLGCPTVAIGRSNQMAIIRKIAGLAVVAMENNETPERMPYGFSSHNEHRSCRLQLTDEESKFHPENDHRE
jgi:hypothetical protein